MCTQSLQRAGSTCNSPTLPGFDLDFHLLYKHPSDKHIPSLPSTRGQDQGVLGIMKGGATMTGWACSSLSRPHGACRERQAEWCSWLRVGDGAIRKTEAGDGQDRGVESSYHCRKLGPQPTGSKGHILHFLTGRLLSHRGSGTLQQST